MNRETENLMEHIEKKLDKFGALDRIHIILELRELLDRLEHEAMTEEYRLDPDYYE